MRPQLLSDTLTALIQVGRNVHVEGAPGLGKTQVPGQVCRTQGYRLIHKHAPTLQPEDIALPAANKDKTRLDFLPASWIPLEGDYPADDVIVVLIDEISQADNSIQKSLANVIQEREVHGYKIHPGVRFVTTGNRVTDRAGANRLLSHLSNRMTRIEFEPHLDDWCNWAIDNGIDPTIISFLRFKSGLLHDFDPQRDVNPTPRAWAEGVSPVIGNVPVDAEFDCIKGAVGEGAAAEFVAFLKLARKLPNPDAVLMDPDNYEVPTDPSTLYAISGAIAHRATPDSFERVMRYAKRMPPEFCVMVVRDAVRMNKEVQHTKAFVAWASGEGSKILL